MEIEELNIILNPALENATQYKRELEKIVSIQGQLEKNIKLANHNFNYLFLIKSVLVSTDIEQYVKKIKEISKLVDDYKILLDSKNNIYNLIKKKLEDMIINDFENIDIFQDLEYYEKLKETNFFKIYHDECNKLINKIRDEDVLKASDTLISRFTKSNFITKKIKETKQEILELDQEILEFNQELFLNKDGNPEKLDHYKKNIQFTKKEINVLHRKMRLFSCMYNLFNKEKVQDDFEEMQDENGIR